jgi:hypothetical protein
LLIFLLKEKFKPFVGFIYSLITIL